MAVAPVSLGQKLSPAELCIWGYQDEDCSALNAGKLALDRALHDISRNRVSSESAASLL